MEINDSLGSVAKLFICWISNSSPRDKYKKITKIVVYQTIPRQVVIYGCESSVLTEKLKSKLQVIEMKFLGHVKRITRRDRNRNDTVRMNWMLNYW